VSKNQILRFPSGLRRSNIFHRNFIKKIEDFFNKTEIETTVIGENRFGLKIMTNEKAFMHREFSMMCSAWIRFLIPTNSKSQTEMPNYTADLTINGKTYYNIFPVSCSTNQNKQFVFVYQNKFEAMLAAQ